MSFHHHMWRTTKKFFVVFSVCPSFLSQNTTAYTKFKKSIKCRVLIVEQKGVPRGQKASSLFGHKMVHIVILDGEVEPSILCISICRQLPIQSDLPRNQIDSTSSGFKLFGRRRGFLGS